MTMRKNIFLLLFLPAIILSLAACDNEDPFADALLYGGGPATDDKTEIGLTMTRVNGWYMYSGDHIYGLDVSVKNLNKSDINNVRILVTGVSPSTNLIDYYDGTEMVIERIAPDATVKPDFHWYSEGFGGVGTIYIGNFYVEFLSFMSAGQTITVNFRITYTLNGKNETVQMSRTFTTITNLAPIPFK
jgi:hypothetical protein